MPAIFYVKISRDLRQTRRYLQVLQWYLSAKSGLRRFLAFPTFVDLPRSG